MLVIPKTPVQLYRLLNYWFCVVCVNLGSSWVIKTTFDRPDRSKVGFITQAGVSIFWSVAVWGGRLPPPVDPALAVKSAV